MDTIKTIEKINGITIPNKFKLFEQNNNYVLYLENELIGREYYDSTNSNTYTDNEGISTYCGFSEINHLFSSDLINGIKFDFSEIHYYDDDDASYINENLYLSSLYKKSDKVFFEFWFKINLFDYKGKDNPILKYEEFEKLLKSEKNINVYTKHADGETNYLEFNYEFENGNLDKAFENIKSLILDLYFKSFNKKKNILEVVLDLPNDYQSILKPYLLYFEEFLNELCIESNIDIKKMGSETILTVEPKNKDEALEKISEALKMYLSAPILSEGLSLEDSLSLKNNQLKELYAECQGLKSRLMRKQIELDSQSLLINNIKDSLIEVGFDKNLIDQNNSILLNSIKSIRLKDEKIDKKTFLKSFKFNLSIPVLFKGSIEIEKDKF